LLYRLRLSNAGLRLQRKRTTELQCRLEFVRQACVDEVDEVLWGHCDDNLSRAVLLLLNHYMMMMIMRRMMTMMGDGDHE
jgi:hypothetical protein